MPRIAFLILPRQRDDPDVGRMCKQFGNKAEAFFRAVWGGRQTEIDQRQLWRAGHVAQQADSLRAVLSEVNIEFVGQNQAE